MEASLGVHTCDKCGKPVKRNQQLVVIAEGWIRGPKRKDLITFWGSCVRYACHLDCWDGVEEDE
jgi:hypothetical protein